MGQHGQQGLLQKERVELEIMLGQSESDSLLVLWCAQSQFLTHFHIHRAVLDVDLAYFSVTFSEMIPGGHSALVSHRYHSSGGGCLVYDAPKLNLGCALPVPY